MSAGTATVPPAKENPEALALRGRPRRPVRFRRGLIVGSVAAAAAGLCVVSWMALEPPTFGGVVRPLETLQPDGSRAEPLTSAPAAYDDVPQLGPPLPGDLGRPILEHRRRAEAEGVGGPSHMRTRAAMEAQEELAAANSSPVLVKLESRGSITTDGDAAGPSSSSAVPGATSRFRQPDRPAAQDLAKQPFEPRPWTLSAGSIIPASLLTGLNSDLPGTVIAQVTEPVRDSATGRAVLIPQGARLLGRYDSAVDHGQSRALLVWTRIVFPNGMTVELDEMPATDSSGYSGVSDQVETHFGKLLKGAALATLLGVGAQLGLGASESALVRAIRESAQKNVADAGSQLTARNLGIRPTVTVRPGWPVRAIVTQDLVLAPWHEMFGGADQAGARPRRVTP